MEKMNLQNDIKTFGLQVKTFPNGIGDAFNELIKKTGDKASERNYYGLSYMDKNGKMIYNAVAEEIQTGEALKFGYETFIIESGEYLTEEVKDWQSKTNCIKDVFTEIMKDENINKQKPAVEWYKNDKEMLCMLKTK